MMHNAIAHIPGKLMPRLSLSNGQHPLVILLCCMVWDSPLPSLGQLSWLCPLQAPHAL